MTLCQQNQMFYWKVFITFFCLLSALTTANARVNSLSKDIRAILVLNDGQLLVGTTGGLLLLDGHSNIKKSWSKQNGLPGTKVFSLTKGTENVDGGLTVWIGTESGIAKGVYLNSRLSIKKKWRTAAVKAIGMHGDNVVAGTWGNGVLVLAGGKKWEPLACEQASRPLGGLKITGFAVHKGTLMVGTANGVYILENGKLVNAAFDLTSDMVFSVASFNEKLWIGTLAGLVTVTTGGVSQVSNADVRVLTQANGALYAGTYGKGVLVYAKDSVERKVFGQGTFVNALGVMDRKLVVGTSDALIVETRDGMKETILDGPASSDISALAFDGRKLWVGTFDAGLGYYEKGRWHGVVHANLDHRINGLAVETKGFKKTIWVATADGLSAITGKGIRKFKKAQGLPHNEIHVVKTLKAGGVLVGTGRFAATVIGGKVSVLGEKRGLPRRAVWAVVEDDSGWLWFGTTAGLYRLRPNKRWARRFDVCRGHLSDGWITALVAQGETLWVGTYAKGVSKLDIIDHKEVVSTHFGGGYVNPQGLTIMGNLLYVATMNGLKRLDVNSDVPELKKLRRAALGKDVTAIIKANQKLWIGSRSGLTHLPAR